MFNIDAVVHGVLLLVLWCVPGAPRSQASFEIHTLTFFDRHLGQHVCASLDSNKCHATSNKCLTSSSKKLLGRTQSPEPSRNTKRRLDLPVMLSTQKCRIGIKAVEFETHFAKRFSAWFSMTMCRAGFCSRAWSSAKFLAASPDGFAVRFSFGNFHCRL